MALSQLYYGEIDCNADDTATSLGVMKSFFYAIVAFLLGYKTGTRGTSGAPPVGSRWAMYYSCDGVTAGTANDGVDRVTAAGAYATGKILRASPGSPASWAVLKSSGSICAFLPATPFYLIVSLSTTGDTVIDLFISKAAPTGGTTTARPTATDEVGLTGFTLSDVTSGTVHRLSYVTDAVGNFYIAMARAAQGIVHSIFAVGQLVAPGLQTGDLFPMFIMGDSQASGRGAGSTGQITASSGWSGSAGLTTRSPLNNTAPNSFSGTGIIGPVNSNWFADTHKHQANSKTDTLDCKVQFNGTGVSSIKGTIPDWLIGNASNAVGVCEPQAPSASEHVNIGYLWLPNAGVVPTY